jgi:hypothetical protein
MMENLIIVHVANYNDFLTTFFAYPLIYLPNYYFMLKEEAN